MASKVIYIQNPGKLFSHYTYYQCALCVYRVEESVESSLGEQADADSAHLLELIRDYLALISSVKVGAFPLWELNLSL